MYVHNAHTSQLSKFFNVYLLSTLQKKYLFVIQVRSPVNYRLNTYLFEQPL